MTELEELKLQKRKLEQRIRELEHPSYRVDGASMYLKKYPARADAWLVRLQEINNMDTRTWQEKQIVASPTKEDAIEALEVLIATLVNLYERVTGRAYKDTRLIKEIDRVKEGK